MARLSLCPVWCVIDRRAEHVEREVGRLNKHPAERHVGNADADDIASFEFFKKRHVFSLRLRSE